MGPPTILAVRTRDGSSPPSGAARTDAFSTVALASTPVLARSTETFEASVAPVWPALVRRLTLVVGDRSVAEDLAQETYLRAFRAWGSFDGADVRAWLYTIGLRLAFNERRRHRRWLAALRRLEPRPFQDAVDPDLVAALGRLDVRTRSALLLSAVDGYTYREIAAMLAVPEGTIASWISRGRSAIRADLAADR